MNSDHFMCNIQATYPNLWAMSHTHPPPANPTKKHLKRGAENQTLNIRAHGCEGPSPDAASTERSTPRAVILEHA